ncbi:hypothetical protein DKT77_04150 [Meridianimarinicoccus roseus]|uniref:Outer membrane protein beta-barrel domain-containing protein n=1 Tax=Meridianimarinicoccus roseus TaxID=2072018 RepID=A0A2V2LIS4_9RHOB|nr:hypothetical protein DKT77_04150 [Meridianimarinicoccus roseus]
MEECLTQIRRSLPQGLAACRIAVLALIWALGPAAAQDPGEVGVTLGVSTLGPTVEGSYRISDRLGVRVPVGYLGTDLDESEDGIDYDLDLTIGGVGLLADYYPGLGGLRVSGGAFLGQYEADGGGRGSGRIGGTDYTNVDMALDVHARNRVMPALSLGYDGTLGRRWLLSADLGAMYTGGFDVNLTDRTGQVSQSDLDAEISDLESDIPDFLPYVKLSVGFRF